MKKTIPFDLFGEKQELEFTISGVAALERTMGKSIYEIRNRGYAGVDFCLAALPIALKKPADYEAKITEYLFAKKGRTIDNVAVLLVHALTASGVYGSEDADRAMAIYYPELFKDKETSEKNV